MGRRLLHTREVLVKTWPDEIMYFVLFFRRFRLWAKSFENRVLICHSRNTVPSSVFNQGEQTSGIQVI